MTSDSKQTPEWYSRTLQHIQARTIAALVFGWMVAVLGLVIGTGYGVLHLPVLALLLLVASVPAAFWLLPAPVFLVTQRRQLEREVIDAALEYVHHEDDRWEASEAFDRDRTPENLARVRQFEDAGDDVEQRLRAAVYALEDAHD